MHLNVGLRKIKETVDQVRTAQPRSPGTAVRAPGSYPRSPWRVVPGRRAAPGLEDKEPGAGGEECGGQRQAEEDGEGPAGGREEKGEFSLRLCSLVSQRSPSPRRVGTATQVALGLNRVRGGGAWGRVRSAALGATRQVTHPQSPLSRPSLPGHEPGDPGAAAQAAGGHRRQADERQGGPGQGGARRHRGPERYGPSSPLKQVPVQRAASTLAQPSRENTDQTSFVPIQTS